jgi:hypothetical protein
MIINVTCVCVIVPVYENVKCLGSGCISYMRIYWPSHLELSVVWLKMTGVSKLYQISYKKNLLLLCDWFVRSGWHVHILLQNGQAFIL